jgi:hypothetical protein
MNPTNNDQKTKNILLQKTTHHRKKSVIYMTLSMAVHFAGHEFARSTTMSMFTSQEMGFQSSSVLPLAVGCISPFSVLLLWFYTRTLKMYGPRYALTKSTVLGASFMLMIGFTLYWMNYNYKYDHEYKYDHGMNVFSELKSISKYLLFALFVYQSANVQFLYTQHWSFIGSVLTPDEVATSGTLIAGIGSITSTFAVSFMNALTLDEEL